MWWNEHVCKAWNRAVDNARGCRKLRGLIVYFEPTNRLKRVVGLKPILVDVEPLYGFTNDDVAVDLKKAWVKQAAENAKLDSRIGFVVIVGDGAFIFSGSPKEAQNHFRTLNRYGGE